MKIDWEVRITYNSLMVALVSLPLVFAFMILSYQLITTAFVDAQVREDIEAYIAVLGILSGPAYMAISRFFDRWNAEEEEHIEAVHTQLTRTPKMKPRMIISDDLKDIDDVRVEHFTLEEYESHETIKAPMIA